MGAKGSCFQENNKQIILEELKPFIATFCLLLSNIASMFNISFLLTTS